MNKYLEGERIPVTTESIKKHIGKNVSYLQSKDVDKSGRGLFFPRYGVITDVYKRCIEFNSSQDYQPFSSFVEIVLV